MAKFKLNPLSGSFDLVGSSGSGPTPTETGYSSTFNTGTWSLVSGKYQIQINEATHQRGINPVVQVFEFDGVNYSEVTVDEVLVSNAGLVTVKVLQSPDLRFQGKLIIR